MKMLMLFNMICLFLFLKLKILSAPKITSAAQAIISSGALPKASTSWPVINKNTGAKTAISNQTDCILCNIGAKIPYFFAFFKN